MAPAKLNLKEQRVLDCVIRYWVHYRVSPSYDELMDRVDFLTGKHLTYYYVKKLVRKGYIKQDDAKKRSLVPARDVDGCMIELIFRRLDGIEVRADSLEDVS